MVLDLTIGYLAPRGRPELTACTIVFSDNLNTASFNLIAPCEKGVRRIIVMVSESDLTMTTILFTWSEGDAGLATTLTRPRGYGPMGGVNRENSRGLVLELVLFFSF